MSQGTNSTQDRVSRARDQLGAGFMFVSQVCAAVAVVAAYEPHGSYQGKDWRWWVSWALLLDMPALILVNAPWALRAVFGVPPLGAARDAIRAVFPTICFVVALAMIDLFILQCPVLWQLVEILIAASVAPLLCTCLAVRWFRGSLPSLVVFLPMVYYFNLLLMLWGGKYAVRVVVT